MPKTTITLKCDNCGKDVTRLLSEYKRCSNHFCSHKCQKEFLHNLTYEDRSCEICGNKFHTPIRSKQRFCSTNCQKIWQTTQTGLKNPRYNRVDVKCSYCGKLIHEFPCKIKSFDVHFCDEVCRRKWYSGTWSQRAEWREQSRTRAVQILASGAISFTNSKPQQIVNEFLDDLGIRYINEYDCKYFAVDNYMPDHDLMIEVMGDFWHTNPTVYDGPKYDKQKTRISRDKAKETYIYNQYHIRVLYLWERDIIERPDVCKMLIHEYLSSDGHLTNYHSFNYIKRDNTIELVSNPVVPFFEAECCEANAQPFGAQ